MLLEFVLGDHSGAAPEWKVGWNPLMWLVFTLPWLLPTVLLVPILHLLARLMVRRHSGSGARAFLIVASPILFVVAVLALWGFHNLEPGFLGPVAVAGLVYGAVFRVPGGVGQESARTTFEG
jgi:hypothetical protein